MASKIGCDSGEILVGIGWNRNLDLEAVAQVGSPFREVYVGYSECYICGTPLGPLEFDIEHHRIPGWPIRDTCAKHCPACSGKEHRRIS